MLNKNLLLKPVIEKRYLWVLNYTIHEDRVKFGKLAQDKKKYNII